MPTNVCDSCGVELIGGACYTRDCPDRADVVDEVLGEPDSEGSE